MAEKVVKDLALLEQEEVLERLALLLGEQRGHNLVEVSTENGFESGLVVFTLLRDLQETHQLVHQAVVVLGLELFDGFLFRVLICVGLVFLLLEGGVNLGHNDTHFDRFFIVLFSDVLRIIIP